MRKPESVEYIQDIIDDIEKGENQLKAQKALNCIAKYHRDRYSYAGGWHESNKEYRD